MSCIYKLINNTCSLHKDECSYPCANFRGESDELELPVHNIFPKEWDELLQDILGACCSARHFDIDIRTETLVDMYKYLKRLGYKKNLDG